ncbi:hypothetical protein P3T36_007195 [Kitasatospora sp. MAP12-15]|nr:hypothetical protein [Kitasatospora sp. MAP12-44]
MVDDGLLDGFGEVLPDVPPVRDVDRVGGAESPGFGVGGGAVAADHLDARVLGQPAGDCRDGAVGQQVDGPARLDVDQDRRVDVSFAQCELVHAEHARRRRRALREGSYQPQQRGSAHRSGESVCQPGAGAAREHQGHLLQSGLQALAPPPVTEGQTWHLLGERRLRAGLLASPESSDL